MSDVINEVEWVTLDIHEGADLSFEFQWWLDDDNTVPQVITAVEGVVSWPTGSLDLAAYTTIDGNSAVVHVPAADLSLDFDRGAWDYTLITDVERKKVARGDVRYFKGVEA